MNHRKAQKFVSMKSKTKIWFVVQVFSSQQTNLLLIIYLIKLKKKASSLGMWICW